MPNLERQATEGDETNVGNVNLAAAAAGSTTGARKATSESRSSANGSWEAAAAASGSASGTESRLGFAILSQASDKYFRVWVRGGSTCLSNIDKSTH